MKYLNFLVLLTLISCSSGEVKRDLEESGSYQTSGVEQFFLAELPTWANFSSSGACYKSSSFYYLNFEQIMKSYQLKYEEMIELQGQYNVRVENYFRSAAVKFLKPVEEASFFSNTLEQVRGGVRTIKIPRVDAIDIIWIDSYISVGKSNELKVLAKSGKFDERLPVLFSTCLSRQGIAQWITENDLEEVGFYSIGAEWLAAYNTEGRPMPNLQIDMKKIFGNDIKLKLFSYENKKPLELVNVE